MPLAERWSHHAGGRHEGPNGPARTPSHLRRFMTDDMGDKGCGCRRCQRQGTPGTDVLHARRWSREPVVLLQPVGHVACRDPEPSGSGWPRATRTSSLPGAKDVPNRAAHLSSVLDPL